MQKLCRISVQGKRLVSGEAFSRQNPAEWERVLHVLEDSDFADDFAETELLSKSSVQTALENFLGLEKEKEAPAVELCTYGVFEKENGVYKISYEESEITDFEGALTTFCVTPDGSLSLIRRFPKWKEASFYRGAAPCMIFQGHTRTQCDYGKELGLPPVFLCTHALLVDLSSYGGTIDLDYSVEIAGFCVERNAFHIEVET